MVAHTGLQIFARRIEPGEDDRSGELMEEVGAGEVEESADAKGAEPPT